jgi:hypothetical protein
MQDLAWRGERGVHRVLRETLRVWRDIDGLGSTMGYVVRDGAQAWRTLRDHQAPWLPLLKALEMRRPHGLVGSNPTPSASVLQCAARGRAVPSLTPSLFPHAASRSLMRTRQHPIFEHN